MEDPRPEAPGYLVVAGTFRQYTTGIGQAPHLRVNTFVPIWAPMLGTRFV